MSKLKNKGFTEQKNKTRVRVGGENMKGKSSSLYYRPLNLI